MKKVIFYIAFIFNSLLAFGQWEYNYFVTKLGLTHQFFNPKPSTINGLFLNSLEGPYALKVDTGKFFNYDLGFVAGLDFHFDLHNDMGGLIVGAEYFNYSFTNKFITDNPEYYLIRTLRMHTVSFPIMVKFGYHIFKLQQYGFLGLRLNWNVALDILEEVPWSATIKGKTYFDAYFVPLNYCVVAGFNFLFFNFEVNYMPQTFLNRSYVVNVGSQSLPYYVKPFSGYPDELFIFTSSLYIPLSPWSSTRSYFLNKILKFFK